jgi:hypothetical protein
MRLLKLTGSHGIGKYSKIDNDVYNLLALTPRKWRVNKDGYVCITKRYGKRSEDKKRMVFLHHIVLQPPVGYIIDHINQDKLDNQRSNLRVATKSLNACNSKRKKTSKYFGVCAKGKKWEVNIYIDGKLRYLGRFENEDEAGKVYNQWSKNTFGDMAVINHIQPSGYSI